ncbi:flagellar hook-basal body complex protein [Sphingomonadales bacterium 56]|jgi:flagellar hook protein FlgE|uniref:flagellar hook-basal body complex protein n=1 Tax=Sphingomonadales TaxID=204457 RepID=UPI000BE24C6B|nr:MULTISPECIES: flagellar hook-basal body complex protein [Sphingomonadaceae]MBY2928333.1 flagellar hook-basal body complex protein [Sphingomonadales bacterium 56]MBY2958433.1 flagellar hook-basal body complex protein [Sphingomonadales bacterium 58]CAD7337042.1 Flagellar basal-body rod protein FlgG [Sphingobium sp. S6]CAD7337099.1 Flagellar basal-body rod protein FlgG [Sphingobium sp. S8]
MSFYISLSGLKAAQTDLATIANNVSNVNSTAFKKSKAVFGDIFAAAPMQTTTQVAGQGARVQGITQQFTQGTIEGTDKTLDLAITGEGFFTVKRTGDSQVSFTRNGALSLTEDRFVVDTTGARVQVIPVDPTTGQPSAAIAAGLAAGTLTSADLADLQVPTNWPAGGTGNQLNSVGVGKDGQITGVYADGSTVYLGTTAMAAFNSQDGLRQMGDAHWTSTSASGEPRFGTGNSGLYGSVRSGALERANVDITEELVALISAQRNFQANSKAIEAANTLSTTIVNMRT